MNSYPNVTWDQFNVCNDDKTKAFEDMCRRIFTAEFLKGKQIPHSDHNTPGVEVLPICEVGDDINPKRRISFQSKFFDQSSAGYGQIKKSAKQIVKIYKGKLDLVYLFSNKTITTTSKSFISIKKILLSANIEIYPISNSEVLDLVVKYPNIAYYFFLPRKVADTNDMFSDILTKAIKINNTTGEIIINPSMLNLQDESGQMLEEVISEKATKCKEYILELKIRNAITELDSLLKHNIDAIGKSEIIYYYKALLAVYEDHEATEYIERCSKSDCEEINWFSEICAATSNLLCDDYVKHSPVVEVLLIDKLFQKQEWLCIIDLYKSTNDKIDTQVRDQLELYYGLALFNLQRYEEAHAILNDIYKDKREDKIKLYIVLTELFIENILRKNGRQTDDTVLENVLNQLNELKGIEQYENNIVLIDTIKMESLYHLGLSNITFAENAIMVFNEFPETIKNEMAVSFYYALCLELKGELKKAISIYRSIDWRHNSIVAEVYLMACVFAEDYCDVISSFNELSDENRTIAIYSLYLHSLNKTNDSSYHLKIKELIKKHKTSLSDLIEIAVHVEDESTVNELLIPAIKLNLNHDEICALPINQTNGLICFLSQHKQIELLEITISYVMDLSVLNRITINEIYKAIFEVANREYLKPQNDFEMPNDFESADKISSLFLDHNIGKKYFL